MGGHTGSASHWVEVSSMGTLDQHHTRLRIALWGHMDQHHTGLFSLCLLNAFYGGLCLSSSMLSM